MVKKGEGVSKMECPKCGKGMVLFLAGKYNEFVPLYTQYVCLYCGIAIENHGKYDEIKLKKMVIDKELKKLLKK